MDRGVLTYSAAYLSGAAISFFLPDSNPAVTAITFLFLLLTILLRKHTVPFIVCSHIAIFTAGNGICSTALHNDTTLQPAITKTIALKARTIQNGAANHLKKIVPDPKTHATLCAIAIGEKGYMGKDLKRSYSAAGAMHVLALSGLHIGIAFAIMYNLLLPLIALPGGRRARNIIALIFIVGYSIFSGCSPSVMRAAIMIILYKIAAGKFRHISNWDAIAISAMLTSIFFPLQISSIGFQLSYCAVIGITLLFPTCNNAFKIIVREWKGSRRILWKMLYWLWSSLSISICCQITTLPLSLYHFGYSAPYFLLANLVAVPLATLILYTLTLTLCLQWVPYIGEWLAYLMNLLITLLNFTINYIAV